MEEKVSSTLENTCHRKQNLERNVTIKGTSWAECAFGNWKKKNSCYKVWKFLAEVSSAAGWEAGLVSRELGIFH